MSEDGAHVRVSEAKHSSCTPIHLPGAQPGTSTPTEVKIRNAAGLASHVLAERTHIAKTICWLSSTHTHTRACTVTRGAGQGQHAGPAGADHRSSPSASAALVSSGSRAGLMAAASLTPTLLAVAQQVKPGYSWVSTGPVLPVRASTHHSWASKRPVCARLTGACELSSRHWPGTGLCCPSSDLQGALSAAAG